MAGNLILIFLISCVAYALLPLVLIDTHDRSIALVMKLRSELEIRKPARLACYRKYEHLLHLAPHLLLNYVR